jgi:hypothetical protein
MRRLQSFSALIGCRSPEEPEEVVLDPPELLLDALDDDDDALVVPEPGIGSQAGSQTPKITPSAVLKRNVLSSVVTPLVSARARPSRDGRWALAS